MKTTFIFILSLVMGWVSAQELAVVGKDKKFGFMDKSGKIAIPI